MHPTGGSSPSTTTGPTVEDAATAYQLPAADGAAAAHSTIPAGIRRTRSRRSSASRTARSGTAERRDRPRRGFLASAAEGTASPRRPPTSNGLELRESELHHDDLSAALTALWAYYLPRGDIHRASHTSRRSAGRLPTNEPGSGRTARRGRDGGLVSRRVGVLRALLEESAAALAEVDVDVLDAVWSCRTSRSHRSIPIWRSHGPSRETLPGRTISFRRRADGLRPFPSPRARSATRIPSATRCGRGSSRPTRPVTTIVAELAMH